MKQSIIGITGPAGAGKGVVVEYLSKKGFTHFSVRAFLTEEITKRKLPLNRDSMIEVANDLRQKHGPSYIIEQLYMQALQSGKPSIIESIRAVGEVSALREKPHFILLAIDADQQVRYQRITSRGNETDSVTFEAFALQEEKEMKNDDMYKQNVALCMKMADYHIDNNSTFEALHEQIDSIIGETK
ncbi:MAG: AAA family ATPase [Candidatus Woesearchaeota archaeon]